MAAIHRKTARTNTMTPAEDTRRYIEKIKSAMEKTGRRVKLMEVCGTHTHAIARAGLKQLLHKWITLVSGPGCPVCVTSQRDIEKLILLARKPNVTIATFGDMMRVPGLDSSLERERAGGADVKVVYSPLDALDMAVRNPSSEIVFPAVGFETTAPGVASMLLKAQKLKVSNLSAVVSHKLILPAMEAVLQGGAAIDGFLTPGHVSVIIGSEAYGPLARKYRVPCVAAGFEPEDILEGVSMLTRMISENRADSVAQYTRAVSPGGNPRALEIMMKVFREDNAEWRGLGEIPRSGLSLKPEYSFFNALERFQIPEVSPVDISACRCGEVIKGLIDPNDCPLLGNACTPSNPAGPCMVSSEGSCSARYKYG